MQIMMVAAGVEREIGFATLLDGLKHDCQYDDYYVVYRV